MDGLPKIDSWTKSRSQSPSSTAAKTGGISEIATPKTRVFEPTDQPNRVVELLTKSETQPKKPYQIQAVGGSQELMTKEELEQLITRNISLEETVRLLKDRLLQYEQVLVGLHRLSREIKATHQQLQGGVNGLPGQQSTHSSAGEWSSPHVQDTDSVNYSKFAELIGFYREQDVHSKQLGLQCGALDKEVVQLEEIIESLKKEISDLKEKQQAPQIKETPATHTIQKENKEEAELKKLVLELTREKEEWNREKQAIVKENEDLAKEDFKLKQLVSELQESLKDSRHDLERERLLAASAPPRNLSIPLPSEFSPSSPENPKKHTTGSEQVRWEHVREHLTEQVNVYLDLQTRISTRSFEVRCIDNDLNQRQPVEVNLLLEVEKILDGLDARLQG